MRYVHRVVMRCLALGGERNAALQHYQAFRELLLQQLNIEPPAGDGGRL